MTWEEFWRAAPPIVQAISIAITAFFAVRSLRAWRIQLVGKRKFEVAEETILAANKAFESLQWIRNGAVFSNEAKDRPKEGPELDNDARLRDTYWVPLKRIHDSADQWAELGKVRLLCKIHLGSEAADAAEELFKVRREVTVASRMLVDGVGHHDQDKEFYEEMRKKIWSVEDEADKLLIRSKKALKKLDEICGPHLK